MNLQPIPTAAVRDVWPVVKKGLHAMLLKYKDRWTPEDVYVELRTATAFLYLLDHEQETIGFIVCKNYHDVDGLALFVWILYAEPQTLVEHRQEMLAEMDKLARSVGAKRIRHHSNRSGWEEDGAFELKQHIYEREVAYG